MYKYSIIADMGFVIALDILNSTLSFVSFLLQSSSLRMFVQ